MTRLVLEPTSTAQWYALVNEAETACGGRLEEDLESYLVFLLMRFAARPELAARVLALDYLEGALASGRQQAERLRDVGDQCLLYSGLYPGRARRRLVRISYFVDLGRSAYHQLAQVLERGGAQMYDQLAEAFVALMDVLQAMRELGGGAVLQPVEAAELWTDTGSSRAWRSLRAGCDGVPAPAGGRRPH